MGARSLRMKQLQQVRLLQYQVQLSCSPSPSSKSPYPWPPPPMSIPYPPAPSTFSPPSTRPVVYNPPLPTTKTYPPMISCLSHPPTSSPSPVLGRPALPLSAFSPIPAPLVLSPSAPPPSGGHHQSPPKAAIIGGSIAGFVVLAVTATIISTVTRKLGRRFGRLFLRLFKNLELPCAGNVGSTRYPPNADDPEMALPKVLSGFPSTVNKEESAPAAAIIQKAPRKTMHVAKTNSGQKLPVPVEPNEEEVPPREAHELEGEDFKQSEPCGYNTSSFAKTREFQSEEDMGASSSTSFGTAPTSIKIVASNSGSLTTAPEVEILPETTMPVSKATMTTMKTCKGTSRPATSRATMTKSMASLSKAGGPSEKDADHDKDRHPKEKRHKNLGQVSFSCAINAHRLHFFTSCRSGATYGSPLPATLYDHKNYDHTINKGSHNYSSDNNINQDTNALPQRSPSIALGHRNPAAPELTDDNIYD